MFKRIFTVILLSSLLLNVCYAQSSRDEQISKLKNKLNEAKERVAFGWPQTIEQLFNLAARAHFSDSDIIERFDFYKRMFENVNELKEKGIKKLNDKIFDLNFGGGSKQGLNLIKVVGCQDQKGFIVKVDIASSSTTYEGGQPEQTSFEIKEESGIKHKIPITEFTRRDRVSLYKYIVTKLIHNDSKFSNPEKLDLYVGLVIYAYSLGMDDEAEKIFNITSELYDQFDAELMPIQRAHRRILTGIIRRKQNLEKAPDDMVKVGNFSIDKYEYSDFLSKDNNLPMTQVSWYEAKLLCEIQGKRLCSGTEWKTACEGANKNKWPYGPNFIKNTCNTANIDTNVPGKISQRGRFEKCVTKSGIFDMSGNVWEWTSGKDPMNPADNRRLAFGGSYFSVPGFAQCSTYHAYLSKKKFLTVGFRCCFGKDILKGIFEGEVPQEAEENIEKQVEVKEEIKEESTKEKTEEESSEKTNPEENEKTNTPEKEIKKDKSE